MNMSCVRVGVRGCVDQAPSSFPIFVMEVSASLYMCVFLSCVLVNSAFKSVKLPLSNNKSDLIYLFQP
jgi:hypothetical protein